MQKNRLKRISIAAIVVIACIVVLTAVLWSQGNPRRSSTSASDTQIVTDHTAESGAETGEAARKTGSLADFLKHSFEPVGKTLYVWGGGWNEEDDGAGLEGTTIGIPQSWTDFFYSQDYYYNYANYPYEIHDGLDCSGFVGWTLYNTLETESGKEGYVVNAKDYGDYLSGQGWGTVTPVGEIQDYKAGDIMFNETHVFIVLGQYEDGSLLIVHSSPPGVQISGTPTSAGIWDSIASERAKQIMAEYAPDYYETYPMSVIDNTYNTTYSQFRWNDTLFPDASAVQQMGVEEIVSLITSGQ